MAEVAPSGRRVAALGIDDDIVAALREQLSAVATQTVGAIIVEVPGYTSLTGTMGENIEAAVQMALAGFLKLASRHQESDPSTPLAPTLDGAYALGRGEARSGRSMDALLSAYRVGARVAWREMAQEAARAGLEADRMAEFAELVFAYIDQLSAASVAGHADELATTGRVRERYLERLGQQLVSGAGVDALMAAAERAGWTVPRTLTAVLVPVAQVRGALSMLTETTLLVGEDLPGSAPGSGSGPGPGPIEDEPASHALLLVPDADGLDRAHLLRTLHGRSAVVGPARPWTQARSSYQLAVRTQVLVASGLLSSPPAPASGGVPHDSEEHLAELVVTADPEALADLSARVLEPLGRVRPATADRLTETLRSWLLHQGRRDAVAAELHVHPQTVRYRMGQVRELYGARLEDPRVVLELLIALASRGPSRRGGLPDSATGSAPST